MPPKRLAGVLSPRSVLMDSKWTLSFDGGGLSGTKKEGIE